MRLTAGWTPVNLNNFFYAEISYHLVSSNKRATLYIWSYKMDWNGLLWIFHFHSCNGNKQRFFPLYNSVIREQKHDKIHFTNSGFFSVPCLLSHCPTPTNSVAAGNLLLMHGQPNICKQCTEVEWRSQIQNVIGLKHELITHRLLHCTSCPHVYSYHCLNGRAVLYKIHLYWTILQHYCTSQQIADCIRPIIWS